VKHALAADNYLLREYRNNLTGERVELFIAYYRSQRSGDALHSPKNCLPAAGWQPLFAGTIRISDPSIPGSSFIANRYVIERDGAEQDVLYWYQAHGRRFASEYLGKLYLAWDGITSGQTDGALIRISTDRTPGDNQTFREMVRFAQDQLSILPRFLPN
jgi:EpsI family protein